MTDILKDLKDLWALVLAGAGVVAWSVRLESRSNTNSREVVALRREVSSLEARLAAQRAEDIANRQRDSDQMNSRLDSIQSDIKLLLQRAGS